jgi:PAS domain S-box-containing protein
MGELMRSIDWAKTPVGPVESWPQSLKTALGILLKQRTAVFLFWGPEHVQFYNDAYWPILGSKKHPAAMGQRGAECWPEIWDILRPMLETVHRCESTAVEDGLLVVDRDGYLEEGYYTYTLSPIVEETGTVGGVFCVVYDTTARVIGERRLRTLRDLASRSMLKEAEHACSAAAAILSQNPHDVPFASIYLYTDDRRFARLAGVAGSVPGSAISPLEIAFEGEEPSILGRAANLNRMQEITDLARKLGPLPVGPWPVGAESGIMLPLAIPGQALPAGFMVAGINPRKRLDASYRTFFELVAAQIATAIAEARSYEEGRRRAEALAELGEIDKLRQEARADELRTLRKLIEHAPALVALLSGPDHVFRLVNRECAKALGRSESELIGMPIRDAIPEIVGQKFMGHLDGVYRTGESYTGSEVPVTPDPRGRGAGKDRYFNYVFQPWTDGGGTRGVLIHSVEVTEQVLARRHLEEIAAERMRAESTARLLAAIVDSSDDAIISKDLHGVITSWNLGAERLFGYTADEVTGKPITILIPWERLFEETEILSRLQRGERVDHFETVRRRKDGSLLDISLTISPVRNAEGVVIGASKIARDITGRRRAEEAIEVLNRQLTADLSAMARLQQLSTRLVRARDFGLLLGEAIDAVMEITGADMGNIQLLENGALKIVAYRGFEQPFLEFFDRVREPRSACGAASRMGQRIIVEDVTSSPLFADSLALEVIVAAGVRAVQSTPLVSRSGQVLGVFSTHYRAPHRPDERELRMVDVLARQAADLIERSRAEEALRQSEARFRQLAEVGPQFIWVFSPDGELEYVNQRWTEYSGLDLAETATTGGIISVAHPEDQEELSRQWRDSLSSGNALDVEGRLRRADGAFRWFVIRSIALRDEADRVVKWFAGSTDIHEQKQVEAELRRVNQDLEQFAYSATHDLQEPLRSVKIYSELLRDRHGEKLDGQALEFLEYLCGGASRMEMLIRDLLAYTQVARLEPPSGVTDANYALEEVLANLKQAIADSGARITADRLPTLHVHGTHLKQLFQNLIGNAIKYRSQERKPEVHVACRREDSRWVFIVSDNGIGIDPEYKERIFGLFKRLHTGDEYAGTGIGLAICHRIVERYHGRIWVESEAGKGSNFFFSLPV